MPTNCQYEKKTNNMSHKIIGNANLKARTEWDR